MVDQIRYTVIIFFFTDIVNDGRELTYILYI